MNDEISKLSMVMPFVQIIICTYHESSNRYLDLCIKSLNNLSYPRDRLDVILVTRKSYMPQYEGVRTIAPPEESFYPERAVNFAVEHINPNSEYIFLMNDDAFFTKHSLTKLVDSVYGQKVIANGLSPCDNYFQYQAFIGFKHQGQDLILNQKFYRYEDFEPYIDSLLEADSIYPQMFVNQQFLCIYATIMPIQAWKDIGPIDENYELGQSDLDWSLRAARAGYAQVSSMSALFFHFGGASNAPNLDDSRRKKNIMYFKEKWGAFPPGLDEGCLRRLGCLQ